MILELYHGYFPGERSPLDIVFWHELMIIWRKMWLVFATLVGIMFLVNNEEMLMATYGYLADWEKMHSANFQRLNFAIIDISITLYESLFRCFVWVSIIGVIINYFLINVVGIMSYPNNIMPVVLWILHVLREAWGVSPVTGWAVRRAGWACCVVGNRLVVVKVAVVAGCARL